MNYGVIGNCKTAALVSQTGSIDWLCLPRFDAPAVFSKILDEEKGGSLAFEVADNYKISQEYLQRTNILRTSFSAAEGAFEVLDFMPRYRTPESDYYTSPEVYRYIRRISGAPRFRIRYDPVLNYAAEPVVHEQFAGYIKSSSRKDARNNIYLYSSMNFDAILNGREIIPRDEEFLLLSYNQKLITIDIRRIYLEYQRTKVYWLNWDNRSRRFSEYNEVIARSLLILKMMAYQDTGAMVAALTTSLPETIGASRNWDYRYCWIRDASMSIETLMKLGHQSTAKRFMAFINRILKSKSDTFRIMYSIDGERDLKEEILPHLSGYKNSVPVRLGNAAHSQQQNDSLGYLMDVIHSYYFHFPGTLDELEEIWEVVKSIVRTVCREWQQPDNSIWEFRNRKDHFVFSKVMCWVALDRAVSIAVRLGRSNYEQEWRKEAELIREDILCHGWNEQLQSFTQSYGNTDMDASLLLMEQYGFLPADDERFIKTVRRVKAELFHKGLMFRYKNHDDFGAPSSAFTICTFWLVRALYVVGRQDEALHIFNDLLQWSNHLGLFSEDLDFDTKCQLGNYPQAYSLLALINTALLFNEEKKTLRFIRP